jgi:preprotein translocase subunit YajC
VNAGLLLIILFAIVMYVLIMRPQRRRRMSQQDMLGNLAPGDEIVTAGGLYGTVQSVRDDELSLEVAPGVEVRIAKRAVAAVVSEPEHPAELEEDDDEGAELHEETHEGVIESGEERS